MTCQARDEDSGRPDGPDAPGEPGAGSSGDDRVASGESTPSGTGAADEGQGWTTRELAEQLYDELRTLAAQLLERERSFHRDGRDHTLQPTELANMCFLRMEKSGSERFPNRRYFFAEAAEAIRRILVEWARRKQAKKRRHDVLKVSLEPGLDDPALADDPALLDAMEVALALEKLQELSSLQARVVSLKSFGGLSLPDIAEVLDLPPKTVKDAWTVARAWLKRELGDR